MSRVWHLKHSSQICPQTGDFIFSDAANGLAAFRRHSATPGGQPETLEKRPTLHRYWATQASRVASSLEEPIGGGRHVNLRRGIRLYFCTLAGITRLLRVLCLCTLAFRAPATQAAVRRSAKPVANLYQLPFEQVTMISKPPSPEGNTQNRSQLAQSKLAYIFIHAAAVVDVF
jgi:hypothetical protein